MRLKAITDHNRVVNVLDYGAVGDGVTNDTAAIQAAINAIPVNGGTVYFPAGKYIISAPLTVSVKNTVLCGYGCGTQNNTTNATYHTALQVASTWNADEGMIQTNYLYTNAANAKGGLLIEGLTLLAGLGGTGSGVCGIHVKKQTGDNHFWGDLTLRHVSIFNGNKGVYFDANGSSAGFGWVTLDNVQIGSCNYGVHCSAAAGQFINVFRTNDSKIWQNRQGVSGGNYQTRTGGGILIENGNGITIRSTDLEGNQVGIHTGAANVVIDGDYFEACTDAAIVLVGARNVRITGMGGTGSTGTKDREVYCYNCDHVRLENSGVFADTGNDDRAYLIVAPYCRDITSDTPTLTRYTIGTTGSFTLEDYGFVIRGEATHIPRLAPRSANILLSGVTLSNATHTEAWTGVRSPFGQKEKVARLTATAGYGGATFDWPSTTLETGQYAIISLWVRCDVTSTGVSGNFLYTQLRVAAGIVFQGTITDTRVHENEWVQLRFIYKELSGAARQLGLSVSAPLSGDFLDVAYPSMIISRSPEIDGFGEVFGSTQRYLYDGVNYWGTGTPVDTNLTWLDSDAIYETAAVAAGNMGIVCTTPGAGGTAVFKAFGVIAA